MIEKSGNLYPYYDYAHGFGIPNSSNYLNGNKIIPTFELIAPDVSNLASYNPEEIFYKVTIKDEAFKEDEGEGKQILYYQIINENNKLEKYFVVDVTQKDIQLIPLTEAINGKSIRISYKNFFKEFKF